MNEMSSNGKRCENHCVPIVLINKRAMYTLIGLIYICLIVSYYLLGTVFIVQKSIMAHLNVYTSEYIRFFGSLFENIQLGKIMIATFMIIAFISGISIGLRNNENLRAIILLIFFFFSAQLLFISFILHSLADPFLY